MVKKRRGAAVPELITVQAVILVGLLFAFTSLGDSIARPMCDASSALNGSTNASARADGDVAYAEAGVGSDISIQIAEHEKTEETPIWIFFGIVLLMIATTAIHLLYRRYCNQQGAKRRKVKANKDGREHAAVPPDRLQDKREQIAGILSENWESVLENKLSVRHFMTPTVTVVSPSDSLQKIHDLVDGKQFRHLIVKNMAGDVVGVISDRDEIRRDDRVASDIMTRNPILIHEDVPVNLAVSQMISNRISCLPVVSDQGLVGVLTTSDVMLAFQCTLRTVEMIRQTLHRDNREQSSTPTQPEPHSAELATTLSTAS